MPIPFEQLNLPRDDNKEMCGLASLLVNDVVDEKYSLLGCFDHPQYSLLVQVFEEQQSSVEIVLLGGLWKLDDSLEHLVHGLKVELQKVAWLACSDCADLHVLQLEGMTEVTICS